jgi:menaquinone-9 beta-reductase
MRRRPDSRRAPRHRVARPVVARAFPGGGRSGIRLYAPDRTVVPLRGHAVCLRRHVLDDLLRQGAVEAGAAFFAPLKAVTPLVEGNVIRGAVFQDVRTQQQQTIRAQLTLLATGGNAEPLAKFGVCRRKDASATAARVYVNVGGSAASLRELVISFDATILPGYGWIFPSQGTTLNVGVGLFYDAWKPPASRNVRVLFEAFLRSLPRDFHAVKEASAAASLKGAPLRTAMGGAAFARPGLLVIGEAAGLTYSLTGEGIGKAMESGMLAADLAASSIRTAAPEQIARAYARELTQRYARKFRGYKRAQAWMNSERLANFLAKRANAGHFVRAQLEGMFADTSEPQDLLSVTGIARAIVT